MFHGMTIFTKPFPLQIGPSFGLLIDTFEAFFGYNNCMFWDAVGSWMIFWKMMLEKFNPIKSHLKMAWLRVTCVYLLAHRHTGPKLSLPEFCGIFYTPYSWLILNLWESKGYPGTNATLSPKKYSRPCEGILKPTIIPLTRPYFWGVFALEGCRGPLDSHDFSTRCVNPKKNTPNSWVKPQSKTFAWIKVSCIWPKYTIKCSIRTANYNLTSTCGRILNEQMER